MRKLLVGLPVTVVMVLLAMMALPFCGTCGEHDEAVTDVVRACPQATKLLGSDARPARMGVACGSTKLRGDNGVASWTLPYTGEHGRGTVRYNATMTNDVWRVDGAELTVDGITIDLLECTGLGQNVGGTLKGRVTTSTHEAVKPGGLCHGRISRASEDAPTELTVKCGDGDAAEGVVVYRGRAAAKISAVKGREAIDYLDTSGATNAKVTLTADEQILRVWSVSPAWEIVADFSERAVPSDPK